LKNYEIDFDNSKKYKILDENQNIEDEVSDKNFEYIIIPVSPEENMISREFGRMETVAGCDCACDGVPPVWCGCKCPPGPARIS